MSHHAHSGMVVSTKNANIKAQSSVSFLDVNLLITKFLLRHINNIFKCASRQRISYFQEFKSKNILIESCVYSHINYCQYFLNTKSGQKMENIKKRAHNFCRCILCVIPTIWRSWQNQKDNLLCPEDLN